MTLKKVEPIKLDRNNVDEVLDRTREKEFESVIIFGFKERGIHVMQSGTHSNLEIMGALDAAKHHVWESSFG